MRKLNLPWGIFKMVCMFYAKDTIPDEEFFDDSQVMQNEEKWLDEEMSNIQTEDLFINEDVPF
jgi:hypothetical protein